MRNSEPTHQTVHIDNILSYCSGQYYFEFISSLCVDSTV